MAGFHSDSAPLQHSIKVSVPEAKAISLGLKKGQQISNMELCLSSQIFGGLTTCAMIQSDEI